MADSGGAPNDIAAAVRGVLEAALAKGGSQALVPEQVSLLEQPASR